MPRKPRLFLSGATYHVNCRVARGEFVFEDDLESIEFVETLRKGKELDGWTVFATLAVSRYGYRVCDVANLIHKHRSSITLWLNKGLFNENKNPEFARRLDQLDEQISRSR